MSSAQKFVQLSSAQSSGLTVVVGLAIVSLLAVCIVWTRMAWVELSAILRRGDRGKLNYERIIFHSQLGAYVGSLLVSNMMSSISFIVNSSWIAAGRVTIGPLCSTQAGLSQVADVAAAYFTAAIAVHTFNTLVLHHRLPGWVCVTTTALGWMLAAVTAILPTRFPLKSGPFYGSDGISCGISVEYGALQTALHLLPIFLSALVSVLFYSLIFLILRGTLAIRGGVKLNLDLEARKSNINGDTEYPKLLASIARSMLWYPVFYITLMAPHLLVCIFEASGRNVPWLWSMLSIAAEAFLGVANVSIFYNTIRIMGPAFKGSKRASTKRESFTSAIKNKSPVDVAPPVAAFIPPKAFPPPRSMTGSPAPFLSHGRQSSGESTRQLVSKSGHVRWDSTASDVNAASIGKPIRPAANLSIMIDSDMKLGLPAPLRKTKSPLMRHPTLAAVPPAFLPEHSQFSAVPLGTAAPAERGSQRDSFINMYASRSPAPSTADGTQLPIPQMILNDGTTQIFRSPQSGASLEYGTDSDSAPDSAFGDQNRPLRPGRSFRSAVEQRLSAVDVPESQGLSSLEWATLVADAATSNGGVMAATRAKSARRRSRSMESLLMPTALQPSDVPQSATLRRERTERVLPPKSAANITHWDSKAIYRDSPARVPAYGNTATGTVNSSYTYR